MELAGAHSQRISFKKQTNCAFKNLKDTAVPSEMCIIDAVCSCQLLSRQVRLSIHKCEEDKNAPLQSNNLLLRSTLKKQQGLDVKG